MNEKSKNNAIEFVIRMILTAVIFFAVSIPFKNLFALVPGMTEVRPANAIPPLFGIMWGLPAACGITIGNFISDMVSGSSISIAVQGGITNFLFAYIPYAMWYTMRNKEGKAYRPCLNSVKDMIRYIFIILVDSLVVTIILTLIFEGAGFSACCDSGPLLFFNNFDFAIILGIPILALIGNSKMEMQTPKKKEITDSAKKFWRIVGFVPYIVTILGLGYFFYSRSSGGNMVPAFTEPVKIASMALLCLYCLRPMTYDVSDEVRTGTKYAEDGSKMTSIRAKVTIGFIIISALFIALAGCSAYLGIKQANLERLEMWNFVYKVVGIAVNLVFAVTIGFLWYVEKNISNPVEMLTELVSIYAKQEHTGEEDNSRLEDMCTGIQTKDEIERLAISFSRMMNDIDTYVSNLATVMAEKERVGAELNVATHIQASMLPCEFPDRKEFDIYATMTPAKEVGGDFYDFFMVDDRHLAIVMADVSGKGVPAALFMVIGKTLIKDNTLPGRDLGDVFSSVNNLLCEANSEGLFITAFEGVLDLVTGEFTFVNAGHEMPFVYKKSEDRFDAHKIRAGFVLAGMEDMMFRGGNIILEPGDKIYQYTDGVTEATNANNELFGMDRLDASINKVKNEKPSVILPAIKADIDEFVGEAPQFDDITMLCLEFKERMACDEGIDTGSNDR